MPQAAVYYTAEMVRALPDDGSRYELVWGELLVSPSPVPRHQRVAVRMLRAIADYCDQFGSAEAMMSPADISWGDDTLVQPDIFVVPKADARTPDWQSMRTLLLVVEVLSPRTARHDRFQKRKLYQAQGVGTVWLVDLTHRAIEVWTPERTFPVIETERVEWTLAGANQPIAFDLASLFADL
jgi:Uma2 family endonuclease